MVANPPFSDKRWSTGIDPLNDPYERFKPFGTPPAKQGDYAYLLHIVRSLKSTGKGACILPHGVLFRGNAEADIRRNLVRKGLHQGHHRPARQPLLRHRHPRLHRRRRQGGRPRPQGHLHDRRQRGLHEGRPQEPPRAMDIHKIVDVFNKRLEVPKYSRMVGVEEIEKNEFNLNLPRYIDSQTPEDLQDIDGHLRGGIPAPMSMRSSATGPSARSSGRRCSRRTARATSTSPWRSRRSSPPSTSTRSSSRSSTA